MSDGAIYLISSDDDSDSGTIHLELSSSEDDDGIVLDQKKSLIIPSSKSSGSSLQLPEDEGRLSLLPGHAAKLAEQNRRQAALVAGFPAFFAALIAEEEEEAKKVKTPEPVTMLVSLFLIKFCNTLHTTLLLTYSTRYTYLYYSFL